jgi:hypothetical protein
LFDAWSWGRPFASLIEFTRFLRDPNLGGTRPRIWFWYVTMVLQWAGPIFILLSAVAWRDRRSRIPLAIALSAVVLFSLSPLKQLRYLQVVIPFVALAAALGWSRLHGGSHRQRWLAAAALFLAVPLGLERTLHVLRSKSDAALVAARVLSQIRPEPRCVVLEQKWAYGDRLYLGNTVEIRDLTPRTPLLPGVVRDSAKGADAVALYASDVDEGVARMLSAAGLRRCATFARNRSGEVTLYLPSSGPCPEPEAP